MKRGAALAVALGTAAALTIPGCASCSRMGKSVESNVGGGLDRTVTLYSNTGEELRKWSGKIDLEDDSDEVLFDLDGKRVVIQGGIVVTEEV